MKTKILNEATLTILSKSSNESYSRTAVASFFTQLDPTIDQITDIKTAVSEAVTNSIVHGYKGNTSNASNTGKITITLKILEDKKGISAYIKIKDRGCGIFDIKQAMQPMFTTAVEEERAGLGFAVMLTFMDKVKVYSKMSKGTTVVMTKLIQPRENV